MEVKGWKSDVRGYNRVYHGVEMIAQLTSPKIEIPKDKVADFCKRNHIRKLSLFGSVLRSDFRPDSDIDVLVEFEAGHVPGFIGLGRMQEELSRLLANRTVDLVTIKFVNHRIRQRVLASSEVMYAV